MKYRVGLLVFSEGKMRENVYLQRKPVQDREIAAFLAELKDSIDFIEPTCGEIRSKADIRSAVKEIECANVTAVILYLPIFISPVLAVHTARLIGKPKIIMGNNSKDSYSQLAMLAVAGGCEQIGLSARRIFGDIGTQKTKDELLTCLCALKADEMLKGSTFGCLGGRSLGIITGTADPAAWERIFAVDIEHVDQFEIVRRAEAVSDEKVELYKGWIEKNYGAICYKEGRFDAVRLDKMIRSYLAVKSIIKDYELDFVGIKCQPEMSNGYAVQCLGVQLLNDPYDADGKKEPVVCSCEADHDGALTMQILKLLSQGKPTALQDILYIGGNEMVLANCGSMASYFAVRSENCCQNLQDVYLQPHGFGDAGGAAVQFVCGSGLFTYARLTRKENTYHMDFFTGECVKKPREELAKYSWYRPTSFVNISFQTEKFLLEYGSNHIHCVEGNYVNELIEFCNLKGIPYNLR
jgi:L-fucose/D-arabinose isomerase